MWADQPGEQTEGVVRIGEVLEHLGAEHYVERSVTESRRKMSICQRAENVDGGPSRVRAFPKRSATIADMPVRVAHDISWLDYANRSGTVSGISRAIEEPLSRLASHPDVDITLTGVCLYDAIRGGSLAAQRALTTVGEFNVERGYRSRLGVESVYDVLSMRMASPQISGLDRLRGALSRAGLKALKLWDAIPPFPADAYDIFHSTYLPLPPPSTTGTAMRVATIYDLIPLSHPDDTLTAHRDLVKEVLRSLDPARDWVITVSGHVRSELVRLADFDPNHVFVVPLAASGVFKPRQANDVDHRRRESYGIPSAPYVLTVGMTQPRKNIIMLVDAFRRMHQVTPGLDVNLVVVGAAGWRNEALERALNDGSPTCARIIRTGFVDDRDLPALYSGAVMFVLPSRAEGFGLPLVEAMNCGVAVLAADTSSLPEVVGRGGVLFAPDDPAELCALMYRVLHNPDYRARLQESALARGSEFSWERTALGIGEAYLHIADSRRRESVR